MVSRVSAVIAVVAMLGSGSAIVGRAGAQGAPMLDSLVRGDPAGDAIVQQIYDEGMHHSQAASLAQVLMDSIGPRLTGSPANRAANDWLVRPYTAWGVPAHNEQYGTWRDWTRGPSEIQLIAPRRRMLEAAELPAGYELGPVGVAAIGGGGAGGARLRDRRLGETDWCRVGKRVGSDPGA